MNKETYLQELRKNLKLLSQTDRDEAIEFYEEYFDEAGVENEEKVIEELGEPKTLAKRILVDIVDRQYGSDRDSTDNSLMVAPVPVVVENADPAKAPESAASTYDASRGFGSIPVENNGAAFAAQVQPQFQGQAQYQAQGQQYQTQGQQAQPQCQPQYQPQYQPQEEKKKSGLSALWIVLAALFALPLSPVVFALIIVFLTLIFVAFVTLGSFVIAGGAILLSGLAILVGGFFVLFLRPITGLTLIGYALICTGLGILFMIGSVALIRALANGIASLFGKIVHKKNKKNKAAANAAATSC